MPRRPRVPGTFAPPTARDEWRDFFFPRGFSLLKVLGYFLVVLVVMLGVFVVAFLSFGGWFLVLDDSGPPWLSWLLTITFFLAVGALSWLSRRSLRDPQRKEEQATRQQ